MSERIRLQTELHSRKFRFFELLNEAKRKISSIQELLAGGAVRSLGEIDCMLVYELASKLKNLKEEYDRLNSEIAQIEKELQ